MQDPAIVRDQKRVALAAEDFVATHEKSITRKISAKRLAEIIAAYEVILRDVQKLQTYSYLLFSVNNTSAVHGSFYQNISTWAAGVLSQLLFFEIKLSELPQQLLKKFAASPDLAAYRHFLRRQLMWQPHRLPEGEEKLLLDKSLTGKQALVRLYDQEDAARTFEIVIDGKKRTMSETELLSLSYDPSRKVRKEASSVFNKGLQKAAPLNTFITNMLAQDHALDMKYRKFESPEAVRHLENEVDQQTADALRQAVVKSYSTLQDYYRLKAKLLKLPKLYGYDRYAPIGKEVRRFSFDEARDIVLQAFGQFSPVFGDVAQHFFDKKWIDAQPTHGKRGGAYCTYVTPDVHPYVFMNYTGHMRDVLTLAHELGHAIQGYLARGQVYLHFDWPLTIAETASVFAEMIVFSRIKETLTSTEEKIALYAMEIESIFATVYRQISFYEFEKALHAARAKEGELSTEVISDLWGKTQRKMYGRALTLEAAEDIRWSYIPHFIHHPFYVYAYAFGELLTLSLYDLYKKHPEGFVPKYIDMLSAGGSKSPQELLQPMGVDIHDPKFWHGGIAEIKKLVRELKGLTK